MVGSSRAAGRARPEGAPTPNRGPTMDRMLGCVPASRKER